MGSNVANRPNRIGAEGVTMQWSFRVPADVTLAAKEQARRDETTLSEIMRAAAYAYLGERGWDVDHLNSGDKELIDAEWQARMGRKAPRTRRPRKRPARIVDPIDPTMELDPVTGTASLF